MGRKEAEQLQLDLERTSRKALWHRERAREIVAQNSKLVDLSREHIIVSREYIRLADTIMWLFGTRGALDFTIAVSGDQAVNLTVR